MVAIENYSAWEEGTITHTPIQDGRLLESTIESNWLSVKVLKLKGYHVGWTSKAYHGLTEPRLIYPQLGGSSLLSVLKSSPQIRVLELDIKLKDDFGDEPPPIQFDDLEQLVLRLDHSELSQTLRLLAPGSRLLSLSLLDPYDNRFEFSYGTDFESFVVRSYIDQFNAIEIKCYFRLEQLLSIMPTVRVLAVEHFECSVVDEGGDLHSDFTLDALYVLYSDLEATFTWPSLEWFAKKYKVWKLTLWKYDLQYNGLTTSPWEKAIISHNPHTICLVVIVVPDEGPNPIAEQC